MKLSEDAQLVEELLKNPYGVPEMPSMATVKLILRAGRRGGGGDATFITASEMVGSKFGIQPKAVRDWYLETVGRG